MAKALRLVHVMNKEASTARAAAGLRYMNGLKPRGVDIEARLAEIPVDNRDLTGRLMGDPLRVVPHWPSEVPMSETMVERVEPMTIPDDIAKVARETVASIEQHCVYQRGLFVTDQAELLVASAILAERERCANLALAQKRNLAALLTDPPMSAAANWIESQIRSGRAP